MTFAADHAAAVGALVVGVTVFDATPGSDATLPASAFPYVVLSVDGGRRSSERMAPVAHRADLTVRTYSVGLSQAQCEAARDRVVASLALSVPVVAGRVTGRLYHVASLAPARDEDVPDRTVFEAVDTFTFTSTAA